MDNILLYRDRIVIVAIMWIDPNQMTMQMFPGSAESDVRVLHERAVFGVGPHSAGHARAGTPERGGPPPLGLPRTRRHLPHAALCAAAALHRPQGKFILRLRGLVV